MSLYSNGKVFTKEEIKQLKNQKTGCYTIEQEYAKRTGIRGDETLQELIEEYGVPPLGGEYVFDVIGKYGYTICGICDGFKWTDKIKEITELDAWKIIALCSIYWENSYKESLKKRKYYSENNPYGWKLNVLFFPENLLDEKERYYIELYQSHYEECYNKESGGTTGKSLINERKPPKTYTDGLNQGDKRTKRKIKEYFDKYLDFTIKSPSNKIKERKYNEFKEWLNEEEENEK